MARRKRNGTKPARPSKSTKPPATRKRKPRQRKRAANCRTPKRVSVTQTETRKTTVLSNTEYLGDVDGSTDYTVAPWAINPGQPSTFPWLHAQAKHWEKYEFTRLEWRYKPNVSAYSQAGTQGRLLWLYEPDTYDQPPADKQTILDSAYHASGMAKDPFKLTVPRECLKGRRFVRHTAFPPVDADQRLYDVGVFYDAAQGFDGSHPNVGELYVSYTVVFEGPVIERIGSNYTSMPSRKCVEYGVGDDNVADNTTKYADLSIQAGNHDFIGITEFTSGSGRATYHFPRGNYLIDWFGSTDNTGANGAYLSIWVAVETGAVTIPASASTSATFPATSTSSPPFQYRSDGAPGAGIQFAYRIDKTGGTQSFTGRMLVTVLDN